MWYISTFYRFRKSTPEQFDSIQEKKQWEDWGQKYSLRGLVILGAEGFNLTVACQNQASLNQFKQEVVETYQCHDILFKDSTSEQAPFPRYRIKVRPEIVTLGTPDLIPTEEHRHLTPDQWHEALMKGEGVVIDTRNWYEYRIGTFKNAINPNIEQFTEFPKFMEEKGIQKDQKIFIFCTGGIRCEKGILELERQGYKNVYQLEGGILNYLQKYPQGQFEGECFVFDSRVAVDQDLRPSATYSLCPHCGQPAEMEKTCSHCDSPFKICPTCEKVEVIQETCSKNCAYHFRRDPAKKGRKQDRDFEKNQTAKN